MKFLLPTTAKEKNISTEVADQIGIPTNGQVGKMRLSGPFLAQRRADGVMPLFPCPADILELSAEKCVDNKRKLLVPLIPDARHDFVSNWPAPNDKETPHLRPLTPKIEPQDGEELTGSQSWISARALHAYLAGAFDESGEDKSEAELDEAEQFGYAHLKKKRDLFVDEHRLGIGVEW